MPKKEAVDSYSLLKYKTIMKRSLKMQFPHMKDNDFEQALNYSINKRYYNSEVEVYNNYTNQKEYLTLLELTDYIYTREPIITAYGVLFKKHESVPNPSTKVVDGFMISRKINKKKMFQYPKGSEDFEKYNLAQLLDKIDVNAIYGILGLYVSMLYNLHVAPSITAQGRSLISSATMCTEMFMANNVKFGSLNEVVIFIDNVISEKKNRKYKDNIILDNDKYASTEQCFYKIATTCGYRWIPTEEDLDIIWALVRNLDQEDLNRLYYKNNLYEFMENTFMETAIKLILDDLNTPYMDPLKPPKEIQASLDEFSDILLEYVYYGYQIIDRVDRCDNMIKSVCLISDTDSMFVSMDPWYRYVLDKVKDDDFKILHQKIDVIKYIDNCNKDDIFVPQDSTYKRLAFDQMEMDEFGDVTQNWKDALIFEDPIRDYDFFNDEVIELQQSITPFEIIPQNNLRYSIMNIMAFTIDKIINAYMLDFTKQSHSYRGDDKCRIIMKNEFLNKVTLLTRVKKSYAAIQEVQEGNYLGENGVLDVKGIAAIAKSSMNDYTRKRLKEILYEDILMKDNIDQMQVIKQLAIFEKDIYSSLSSGSKDYYKPLVIKSMSNYEDPMGIQGIKASYFWNEMRGDNLAAIDLTDRNAISIAKVNITESSLQKIKDEYPEVYERGMKLLQSSISTVRKKNDVKTKVDIPVEVITAIAIPEGVDTPEWLIPLIDYTTIAVDNISGFPLESIGISKIDGRTGVNYTNIVKL